MSRATSPSLIAPARIPKITALRDQLGYGDGRLARCATFIDDLRVFRRKYLVAGLRGTDLWDWKSPKHQDALKQMTATFLDDDGNGEVYWPSDPAAANFNSLQYSTDRTFITQTVRQLIFRLNLQQYRNGKYKKKDHQTVYEIIDLEDEDFNIGQNHSGPRIESSSVSTATTTATPTYAGVTEASTGGPPTVPDSLQQEHDIYDVPTSPEYAPESSTTKRKLKAPSRINPQKRSKIVSLKVRTGNPSNPYHRPIAPMPTRTSPRGRKTVPRVNYADVLDLDQPFSPPRSATESTIGRDNDFGAEQQKQTIVGQRSGSDENVFNYTTINHHSAKNESIPPTPIDVPRRATIDSNIDPNLELISSPAFSMNPPTHQASHRAMPSSSDIICLTHASPSNSMQPEAERAPSLTPTMPTIGSTHGTNKTSAIPYPTPEVEKTLSLYPKLFMGSSHGTNKTSATSYPSPAPSDAKKVAEQTTEASPATVTNPGAVSSADSKAGITFNYRVILSRTPIYEVKSWHPEGHFLEKSLSELINELPFENKGGVVGLIMQLTGPGVAFEETIQRGADDSYTSTKAEFMQIVKMCFKNHTKANTGGRLVMNFKIEAVREDSVDEDKEDDDDVFVF